MIDNNTNSNINSDETEDIQELCTSIRYPEINKNGGVGSHVCSYHVYESIWAAALGKRIGCVRELLNANDRYACSGTKER